MALPERVGDGGEVDGRGLCLAADWRGRDSRGLRIEPAPQPWERRKEEEEGGNVKRIALTENEGTRGEP